MIKYRCGRKIKNNKLINRPEGDVLSMSRLGLVVRRLAGKRKDAGSTPRFRSPFPSKIVICGNVARIAAHLNAGIMLVVTV